MRTSRARSGSRRRRAARTPTSGRALWRLQRARRTLVDASGHQLRLSHGVWVDLIEDEARLRNAFDGADLGNLDVDRLALDRDLLPDWYDDWIVPRRERFRQLRLRVLDALCVRLTDEGRLDGGDGGRPCGCRQ